MKRMKITYFVWLGILQKRELFKTQNYQNLELAKIILQILIYLSA